MPRHSQRRQGGACSGEAMSFGWRADYPDGVAAAGTAVGVLLGFQYCGGLGSRGQCASKVAPSVGQPAASAALPLGYRGSKNRLRRNHQRSRAALGGVFAKPALGAGHKIPVLVSVVDQISATPGTAFEPNHTCLHKRRGQRVWNPLLIWRRIIRSCIAPGGPAVFPDAKSMLADCRVR